MKEGAWRVVWPVLIGCAVMALVEWRLRLGFAAKSAAKLAVFGLCLLPGFWPGGEGDGPAVFGRLFAPPQKGRRLPVALLAAGVYGFILAGFWLLSPWLDLPAIAASLAAKERVTGENFLWVSLYISVINTLLEELFFRGLAFLRLRPLWGEAPAALFSSLCFSLYHVSILTGWFSPALFFLMVLGLFAAGLLFCRLDRAGALLPSWGVHMAANLGINTIGFFMFGLL